MKSSNDSQVQKNSSTAIVEKESSLLVLDTKIEQSKHQKVRHPSNEKKKKKRLGKCHVCGENMAQMVCIKCGQPTCRSCYFHLVGLCKKCLSKSKGEKWKGLRPDWEKTLGVEWID